MRCALTFKARERVRKTAVKQLFDYLIDGLCDLFRARRGALFQGAPSRLAGVLQQFCKKPG